MADEHWHPFSVEHSNLGNMRLMHGSCPIVRFGRHEIAMIYHTIKASCGDLNPHAICYDLFPEDRDKFEAYFLGLAKTALLRAAQDG